MNLDTLVSFLRLKVCHTPGETSLGYLVLLLLLLGVPYGSCAGRCLCLMTRHALMPTCQRRIPGE